ncbi:MAG: (2Fe-2S)-binding protein [Acidobacteriaceae bacterium]|nr:(2Fe-2S)-binding protein [Acidobacteriaceae bacterium]
MNKLTRDTPVGAEPVEITLFVNGEERRIAVEPDVTLVDAIRDRLDMLGTKVGCAHGQCGACTVLINGERRYSCITLAVMHDGHHIQTIEGVEDNGQLHPLQQAFIDHDAFQCGFCTPGQIMSGLGLLREGHVQNEDDMREEMSGNLCRCAAYQHITAAIWEVHERQDEPGVRLSEQREELLAAGGRVR